MPAITKILAMLAGLAVLAAACCDEEETAIPGNDFLPLAIGNYWEFRTIVADDNVIVEHREVTGTARIDGHDYYTVVSTFPLSAAYNHRDTTYYRKEASGYVYRRKTKGDETNTFRLEGRDGDSWQLHIYEYPGEVTLTQTSVETGNRTFTDCKAYYYNAQQLADEEHTITLARGLGFVREYSDAWGLGSIVTKARINGATFNLD